MVKEWTIYDKNNTAKAVVKDVELHDVWMGEDYVTMTFTSPTPIQFEIGDYLVYRGATYSIYNVPSVLKSARVSTYGEGFKYDNVKFSARSTELTEIRFHDVVLNDNDLHYTSLAVFSFYCNSVDDLVDRLQANTNRDGSTDWYFITPSKNRTLQRYEGDATKQAEALRLWNEAYGNTYYDDNVTEGKENVNISVSNISVWDGLAFIKNNFGLNYITRDRAVIVGGEGIPTARIFKYGKGNGLYEIERIADTEQQVVTKLFAYGSDKNLPVRYYANLNMRVFATVTRIVTTSPLIYAMLDLDFSGSLFTNRDEGTGNEQYIVTVDDLNGHVETNAMVNLPIGEVPSEEAGKTEIILNWDYPVSVGTKLYFTAGVNRDKWSPDHQDYATENLPNNMAVNSLMLPGFPNYSLAQLCRCVIADGKTTIEIRKTPTSTYTELMTIDGERNLVFSDNKLHPYILSDNAETIGIKEGDIHFTEDTDDNGLKEIFPSIEGMTQGDVFGTSSQVRLDEIHLVDVIEDNGVYAEGTEVQNFKITLKNLGFDLKEAFANAGDSMVISMKDGFCGGRDFNVKSVKQNEDGTWVLNTERSHDDALDLWFPYSDGVSHGHSASSIEPYQIKVGDHFVLTNIELEDTNYVWAASVKLLRNSITWLLNNDYTRFTYLPKVDEIYMARQHDEATRTLTTSLHDTLKAGMLMQFQDTDLNIDGQVFIDNLTIKENGNNGIPTYDVTLRNDKQVGTLQRVQNQINSLASGGGTGSGGGGGINLNQVRGEVESYGNEFFLSKLSDDIAQGEIGFLKGIWIKAKGLFGFDADGNIKANDINATGDAKIGGKLDAQSGKIDSVQSHNYTGDGIADTGYRLTNDDGTGSSSLIVDNLHVRKKATFEELEVKKETAVAGNEVRSAAANVINRTDYLDANGNLLGYSFLTMPWLLKGVPHLLNGIFFGRQRRIRTTLKPEDVSRIATIRCYFLAKDDDREVNNLWEVGDLVRCQTINMNNSQRKTYLPSGSTSKVGNVFWWRKATSKSTSIVTLDDEKEYHYVDVSMTDCAANSDIPCAGDHMVQFGHDSNPDRMNIIVQEINGSDAPSVKAYMGIYTYDLTKCWWGGSPRKMMLSPKSGYEFYGPTFKFVQEYGVKPASIDRGAWDEITPERDDYAPHNNVRKCYYYDKVTHNGCYWLCVYTSPGSGAHWVDVSGNYLTDEQYNALTPAQKELCSRKEDYTTDEPSTSSSAWQKQVDRGTSVQSVTSCYAKQTSAQYNGNPPTSGWESTIAALGTLNEGDYLWTKNVTTYSDTLEDTTTYTVSKWGINGEGIYNIETKFYKSTTLLTQEQLEALSESSWKEYSEWQWQQGDYIYTRTKITYTKGSSATTSYQVNRIGQDGVGYVGTEEYYCLGDNMTTPPAKHPYQGTNHQPDVISPATMASRMSGGSWSEARPTYDTSTAASRAKKYLWNFEAGYTTNASEVQITEPICIANYEKGIASIVETYTISSHSTKASMLDDTAERTAHPWVDEVQDSAPNDDYPYQWNKTVTTYSDGSSDTFYHISGVKGTRGRGITSVNTYFKADTTTPTTPSGAPAQSGWADDGNTLITKANSDANKHLYESTCTTFTDGNYAWTTPLDDGLISDMAATEEEFALADSGTTEPTTGWDSSVNPAVGKWVWSRTKLTFKSGTPLYKYINTQCVGYCGTNGNPGGNTATLSLYKRSATAITSIDWSNTLTYTFSTQALNSVPSGWSLNKIPIGTDPIYVTAATAYSTAATDTIAANEWATPVKFVENGSQGEHGINTAPVFLYKRSATKPSKPTASLTYTFSTGVLSGTLAGWSQNIPATDGNPCWVIQATAISQSNTDTIASTEWSEQRNMVEDGASITIDNSKTFTRFAKSATQPPLDTTDSRWKQTIAELNLAAGDTYWTWVHTHYSDDNATDVCNPGYYGTNGNTPYIQNDYWYINGQSTGVPATGDNGLTPYIGQNGNWWIGTNDTQVRAEGQSVLHCDLSNTMDGVAMTSDGKVSAQTVISTTFAIYYGTEKQTLSSLTYSTLPSGVTATANANTGVVTVTLAQNTQLTNDKIDITITGVCAKGTLSSVLTIQGFRAGGNGTSPVIFQLVPSADSIKKSKAGAYTPSSITCGVTKRDGNSAPVAYTGSDVTIKYKVDGESTEHTYNASDAALSNISANLNITFKLYQGSTLIDVETVPVVVDGSDGKGISSADIMFCLANSQTTAPGDSSFTVTSFAGLNIKSTDADKYVWQCTKTTYTSGNPTYSGKVCIGKVSEFASIVEQYALGSDSAATGTWQNNTPPASSKGSYLWTRTKITYSDNSVGYSPSSAGICLGYYGTDGDNGVGSRIETTATRYANTGSSSTQPSAPWSDASVWKNSIAATNPQLGDFVWSLYGTTPYSIDKNGNETAGTTIWTYGVSRTGVNGTSPYFADIDNEMDSVALDATGKTTAAYDNTINLALWHGSEAMALTTLSYKVNGGTSYTTEQTVGNIKITPNASAKTLRIRVASAAAIALTNEIEITVAGTGSGNQSLHFVLNGVKPGANGNPATIYTLVPSVSSVVKKKDGSYSVNNVSCTRQKNVGGTITDNTTDGTITYKLDGGSEQAYTNNTNIAVTNFTKSIQFIFKVGGVTVDVETIPMVADGDKGDKPVEGVDYTVRDGEDAWSVLISPSPLIINQNIDNTSDFGMSASNPIIINITGLKGDNVATVGTPSSVTSDLGLVFGQSTAGTIRVTGISPVNGAYKTKGTITANVALTYRTQSVNKSIAISVGVQLVGSWKSSTMGDVYTELASKTLYTKDDNGNLIESTNWGEFKRSSEANISTLNKQVKVSNLFIGLDKNVPNGWTDDGTNPIENFDLSTGLMTETGGNEFYSPLVYLVTGRLYVISAYLRNRWFSFNNQFFIYESDMSMYPSGDVYISEDNKETGETIVISGTTYYRCYVVFSVQDTGWYYLNYSTYSYIAMPQVEEGTYPTPYNVGSTTVQSQIKQTADRIMLQVNGKASTGYVDAAAEQVRLGVKTDLSNTGINIEDKIITLTADQTFFKDTQGKDMVQFMMYNGMPSIVFFNENNQVAWVLNYQGMQEIKYNSQQYSWTTIKIAETQLGYKATPGSDPATISAAALSNEQIWSFNNRYRYNEGWTKNQSGVKSYEFGGIYDQKMYVSQTVSNRAPTASTMPINYDGYFIGPLTARGQYSWVRTISLYDQNTKKWLNEWIVEIEWNGEEYYCSADGVNFKEYLSVADLEGADEEPEEVEE